MIPEYAALWVMAPFLGITIGFLADELFRRWIND
jgi:hypothetical protein